MIKITPESISIIPKTILRVRVSWKNKIPKNIAVNGSSAPNTAVFVEPINLIEIVIVSKDIIVGKIASPIVKSHRYGLSGICNSVQNFRLMI